MTTTHRDTSPLLRPAGGDGQGDRRAFARRNAILRVAFEEAGQRIEAATTDVSAAGAFINTAYYVPIGDWLRLAFTLPSFSDPIFVWSRVVRWAEVGSRLSVMPGMGVVFVAVESPGGRAAVQRFVEEVLGAPGAVDPNAMDDLAAGGVRLWLRPEREELPRPPQADAGTAYAPARLSDAPRVAQERRSSHRYTVRDECVYFLDDGGLPCNGIAIDIGASGCRILTRQQVPPVGSRVVARLALGGPFADHWVRLRGRVVHVASLARASHTFALAVEHLDELGTPGIYADYLAYLRTQHRDGA